MAKDEGGPLESSHRLRVVLEGLGLGGGVAELGAQLVRSRRQRLLRQFAEGSLRSGILSF